MQQGLPFETAVETEEIEFQFSLISKGVGFGLAPSDVFHSSPQRKNMKVLKVKDFSPKLAVWVLYSKPYRTPSSRGSLSKRRCSAAFENFGREDGVTNQIR